MKRQHLLTALTLSAALLLSGCGGPGSDPAVTVDGTAYSVADVQEATQQINTLSEHEAQAAGGAPPQAGSTPQDVISGLVILPLLDHVFAGSPAETSDSQIRELLGANGVPDPGPATIATARSRQYQRALSDPATFSDPAMADVAARAQAVTAEDLAAVQVEVNPRYGTWDAAGGGLRTAVPSWIQNADQDS